MRFLVLLLALAGCGAPRPVLLQPLVHAVPPEADAALGVEGTAGGGGGRVWIRPGPTVALYGFGRFSKSLGPVRVVRTADPPNATERGGGAGAALRVAGQDAVEVWASAEHAAFRVRSNGRVPTEAPPCPLDACAESGLYRAATTRTSLGVLVLVRARDDFGPESPDGVVRLGLSLRGGLVRAPEVRFAHRDRLGGALAEPVVVDGGSAFVVEPAAVVSAEVGSFGLTGQVGISRVLSEAWTEDYATDGLLVSVGATLGL